MYIRCALKITEADRTGPCLEVHTSETLAMGQATKAEERRNKARETKNAKNTGKRGDQAQRSQEG